jgi:hypothetical protein
MDPAAPRRSDGDLRFIHLDAAAAARRWRWSLGRFGDSRKGKRRWHSTAVGGGGAEGEAILAFSRCFWIHKTFTGAAAQGYVWVFFFLFATAKLKWIYTII